MSADSLLAEYRSRLLRASSADEATPCTDVTLIELVRKSILEEPGLHDALQSGAFSLIARALPDHSDLLPTLKSLATTFQCLEQAALQLYFTPWRKERHSIKTYSGHYVHVLEAVLPQDGIFQVLGKLGYEPLEDGSQLTLRAMPSPDTLSRAALGFMAAELECCILSDIVSCSGSSRVTGSELIQERMTWRGEEACMERLQRLVRVPRSPPHAGLDTDAVLYQPQFCDRCHESWERHADGCCREKTERLLLLQSPDKVVQRVEDGGLLLQDLTLHDCVFSDLALEQHCANCHLFHSSTCPALQKCKTLGHQLAQLTPSKKREVVKEEQGRKYQLHFCLKPGQLPHYRCAQCRALHYIKCQELTQCRRQGHNATMIMLDKDQKLWLQRSLMDLSQLCMDRVANRGSPV